MSKKLHILFLCGWFPSRVLPTNGDFIQRHAEAIATKHKVTVLHIITFEKVAIDFVETTKKNGVTNHIGYIKLTKNPISKINRFWKIFKEIIAKTDDFDVVHLNEIYPFGLFALHLKKKLNKPFIISEHWTGYHKPQSKKIGFLHKYFAKKIVQQASFVCPVSNNLATSMQDFDLQGNYKIVPNVVDTNLFRPLAETAKQFTIIHISSLLDEHKNVSGMLRVAKELENHIDDFTWQFIGGEQHQYQKLINSLDFKKNSIEFMNHISQEELVNHLQKASAFVLFSNYENLPCVILESFACGIPVISTNVGGIKEFFPKEFGILIDKNDEHQLLNTILEIHQKKNQNKEAMYLYAKKHLSQRAIANQFSELYQQSLNR